MEKNTESGRLTAPRDIERFVTGGNAYFTVVSSDTGVRYTFRVSQKENDDGSKSPFFVSILTGPDNWTNYRYLGTISHSGIYTHGRKSKISDKAPSARCINWLLSNVHDAEQMARIEFWHEGRCGVCGRKLTVPESVASGIGPVCAGR